MQCQEGRHIGRGWLSPGSGSCAIERGGAGPDGRPHADARLCNRAILHAVRATLWAILSHVETLGRSPKGLSAGHRSETIAFRGTELVRRRLGARSVGGKAIVPAHGRRNRVFATRPRRTGRASTPRGSPRVRNDLALADRHLDLFLAHIAIDPTTPSWRQIGLSSANQD